MRISNGKWANMTAHIVDGTKTLFTESGAFVDAVNLGFARARLSGCPARH